MQYRSLGRSGVKVSVIGIGCNQFGGKVDVAGTQAIVNQALEVGINFFDTADVYGNRGGSEEYLGVALAGQWERVVLATKGRSQMGEGPNDQGMSRYHLQNAVEASLRRLKTDHIDLYQIHAWDETTPAEEMLRALDDMVRVGKVRYIGASNFSAWQLAHCNTLAELKSWESFVTIQPHYHMLEREIERELIPYCQWANVGILPYFPLAGGFLTGKYVRGQAAPSGSRGEKSPYVQRYMTDKNYDVVDKLSAFASARGKDMHALAFAWLLGQPQMTSVIAGATSPAQVTANAATADWALTADELAEVRKILES
jgi:aryl-alcohol dehydrogenase-like predicted oxidoreductase